MISYGFVYNTGEVPGYKQYGVAATAKEAEQAIRMAVKQPTEGEFIERQGKFRFYLPSGPTGYIYFNVNCMLAIETGKFKPVCKGTLEQAKAACQKYAKKNMGEKFIVSYRKKGKIIEGRIITAVNHPTGAFDPDFVIVEV